MERVKHEFQGWADVAVRLSRALDAVEVLGVPWGGTRFDRYLQHIRELGATDPAVLGARPGDKMTWEALTQGMQLAGAAALFEQIPRDLLVKKLKTILAGADLYEDSERGDEPRNTLFEFTVAETLASYRFRVQLTYADEDVVALHDELPAPVSVECKHPALSATPRQAWNRVVGNLADIRRQLLRRNPRNIRMGALGVAGVYGLSSGTIARASNVSALSDMVDRALTEAVAGIRRLDREQKLGLKSVMRVGAVVFTGPGLCDGGRGYVITKMRLFVLPNDRRLERALSRIVSGAGAA